MRILKSSGRTVIVASPPQPPGGGGCPRAVVSRANMKIRDDYYGALVIRKGIARNLFY